MQTIESSPPVQKVRSEMALDIQTVSRVLLHSWRLLLLSTTAGAVILLGVSFLVRTTYKATAIILPPDQSNGTLSLLSAATSSSSLPAGALAALGMKKPTDLYVALMSTPVVEDTVIERFGLQKLYRVKHLSEARKKFESYAQIKADGKSGLISIAVIDRDPNRAAQIANGLVESFDQLSSRLAITDAARRRLFFERQVDQTRQNLITSENALRDTIKRTGVIEPEGNARAMIAYQAQLRAQIAAKNVELQSMQVYLSNENPQIQTALRERQALEAQSEELNRTSGGDISDSRYLMSDASLDYLRGLREVRFNEALLELLLKNLEFAKLDEAHEGNLVQIVESATPPDVKNAPHHSVFLAAGAFFGLLISIAWVLVGQSDLLK